MASHPDQRGTSSGTNWLDPMHDVRRAVTRLSKPVSDEQAAKPVHHTWMIVRQSRSSKEDWLMKRKSHNSQVANPLNVPVMEDQGMS